MPILPKSSAFSFSILTILLITLIFVPTVRSIDENPLLLPLDRENNDHSICPHDDRVSCPVKCFTTDPVCGEDGVTYWCGCADAHCAGTRVANLGFCQGQEAGIGRYISKPYFEKHGILDDLQFDNFVRGQILLSSCIDKQISVPKLTSLQRNLIGEGSHRRLSSVIGLEFEFWESFCEVTVIEKLPSGVFADPFELQHLVQRSVFSDASVYGDTNLELPSFRSNRSLVEIHVNLNPEISSTNNKQLEVKIQLPLHVRYPPLGEGYATVKFGNPTIFLRSCREGSTFDQSCVLLPVDYHIESESVHTTWEVPCGSKEHAGMVAFVTFMSAIVSALLIVLTSFRHSNFMVSNETK